MEFEDHASRWLESASDLYDQVVFNTDAVFNKEAPQPWIAFMLGGVREEGKSLAFRHFRD
jgi:hypothetical protein